MNVAGAILTGGASSRMGRAKPLVEVDGVAMGQLVADALLRGGCHGIALIGGDTAELAPLGLDLVADRYPGEGPLGGVITALEHFTSSSHVLVAACDLARLDTAAVQAMIAMAADSPDVAAVAAQTDRLEPALVVWNRSALEQLTEAFDSGTRAVHRVLEHLGAVACHIDAESMLNVNRPADVPGVSNTAHYGRGVAIPEITVEELMARAQAGGELALVDVRELGEWVDGHASQAVHVPLGTVPDHLDAFGADNAAEPTYVICKVGGRSMRACEFAAANGKNVVNVVGGMMAWVQGGHDIVEGN